MITACLNLLNCNHLAAGSHLIFKTWCMRVSQPYMHACSNSLCMHALQKELKGDTDDQKVPSVDASLGPALSFTHIRHPDRVCCEWQSGASRRTTRVVFSTSAGWHHWQHLHLTTAGCTVRQLCIKPCTSSQQGGLLPCPPQRSKQPSDMISTLCYSSGFQSLAAKVPLIGPYALRSSWHHTTSSYN